MNSLMESGYITEAVCGSNFSYILSDDTSFATTEYKVLQNQANSCFVKCMKMMYNGKHQLFYYTKGLKSFYSVLPILDADSFLTIVTNLFLDIVDVKHNGFLSCQNIDISLNKIFVDPTNYKVSLVYIPTGKRIFHDDSEFENEIRTSLVKLISDYPEIVSTKTRQLSVDLSNGVLTLDNIIARIKGGTTVEIADPVAMGGNQVFGQLKIIAMNAPTRVEVVITKDHFVIGKNPAQVDGVISFNKLISRVHCRIDKRGELYEITDLQSANGTYVNRMKIQPRQSCCIKAGDVIRLANSDFQVVIE